MGFDFAAQPFFTAVITFVFGPYFVSRLAADPAMGQAWWGATATVSAIGVALFSPVLGAIADETGPRKPWIAVFAAIKVAALLMLWRAAPGSSLPMAAALIVLASMAAEFSIVFNDSMLPRLVARSALGRVSNLAWGLGYAGGLVFLAVVLAFVAGSPDTGRTLVGLDPVFGLDPAEGEGARATAPLAAAWYVVFVLPMFLLTPDRARSRGIARAAQAGLRDLAATAHEVRGRSALFRFLVARMIYQDGVNGLIVLGGAFAAGLFGWSVTETGLFGILLTVTAIAGCLAASLLDARVGSRRVIGAAILCLLLAAIGIVSTAPGSTLFGLVEFAPTQASGLFASGAEKAYIGYGLLVGLAFGPIQASSRSWLAQSITADEAGRYFGFYALTGRATAFLAPLSVSLLTAWASTWADPLVAARIGMSALILFFIVGYALLRATPEPDELSVPNA
ncbi:MFS transporter [Consotaella aegiceratis]|uniref:MFS transporter n=1 Tax=Consotaella aegiceratis TaxID=3097961 RepID=UPI002F42C0AA